MKKEKQGLCNVYKNIPCFFVYRVKNVMGQLTNRWNRNIIINMERVPLKIELYRKIKEVKQNNNKGICVWKRFYKCGVCYTF